MDYRHSPRSDWRCEDLRNRGLGQGHVCGQLLDPVCPLGSGLARRADDRFDIRSDTVGIDVFRVGVACSSTGRQYIYTGLPVVPLKRFE